MPISDKQDAGDKPAGPTDQTADEIERLWYVPPPAGEARGWPVYTLDFVMATLQGCLAERHCLRRTPGWLVLGTVVRGVMIMLQALIVLLSWIPVVSWFVEIAARTFTRNVAGFFLRACYWKARLKHLGQDTIIDQSVEIWGPTNVSIGSNCHIDTGVRLAAGERGQRQHGSIVIGNYVHLGPGVHIAGRGGVLIGDNVGVSSGAHFYSASNTIEFPSDPGMLISMSHSAPHDRQHVVEGRIVVEEYAFVGMMARIMPGVRIGRGAVVHANTVLTRSVPAMANVGGIPRGRHIGWRKPRRPSPRLLERRPPSGEIGTASQTSLVGGLRIRQVCDPGEVAVIDQVIHLHEVAFAEGVTTQLGRDFLRQYYLAMVGGPALLWVAEAGGQVCGFMGCTTDRHAFERAHRGGGVQLLAMWRMLSFRLSPFAVLRAMRKQRFSRDFPDRAELLSIVVSPSVRRSGLGKAFLDAWYTALREREIPSFIVFTDNPEGMGFYEKYEGECLFKFRLRTFWSACYRFTIGQPPGMAASSDRAETKGR